MERQIKSNQGPVVFAGLVDAALVIVLFVVLVDPLSSIPFIKSNPNLAILMGFILYRLVTIMLFSSTPGMKAFRLTFLNGDGAALNLKEKLLASVFILFQGVGYYKGARTSR